MGAFLRKSLNGRDWRIIFFEELPLSTLLNICKAKIVSAVVVLGFRFIFYKFSIEMRFVRFVRSKDKRECFYLSTTNNFLSNKFPVNRSTSLAIPL